MQIQKVSAYQAFKGQREIIKPKLVCTTYVKLPTTNEGNCIYQPVVLIFKPIKDTDSMVDDGKGKGLQYA